MLPENLITVLSPVDVLITLSRFWRSNRVEWRPGYSAFAQTAAVQYTVQYLAVGSACGCCGKREQLLL